MGLWQIATVLRPLLFALVFALAACAARAQPAMSLTSDHVGPVGLGMTEAEIRALGFSVERQELEGEGGEYTRLVVRLADDQVVEADLYDEVVADMTTTSQAFVTDRGARVGMTLSELRALYPEGRVNIGREEGSYFNYAIGPSPAGSFQLGERGVPETCFDYRGECPDLGAQRSVSYYAVR